LKSYHQNEYGDESTEDREKSVIVQRLILQRFTPVHTRHLLK
jgi:hypothetical protein